MKAHTFIPLEGRRLFPVKMPNPDQFVDGQGVAVKLHKGRFRPSFLYFLAGLPILNLVGYIFLVSFKKRKGPQRNTLRTGLISLESIRRNRRRRGGHALRRRRGGGVRSTAAPTFVCKRTVDHRYRISMWLSSTGRVTSSFRTRVAQPTRAHSMRIDSSAIRTITAQTIP